ncbi:ubiquinone-dependent pyruvate dehydrogenase [Mucilaginibacter rubeus]|uniref:Ubiquinone-dependent pyruvate dehydrogenase n=1 Tax=Mucilaginibacter rubeus TaxID=2027860 RepID=A0AAE6MI11_9SPHI|nr:MULTISPECIES: thiamine pyrophosphate-dependent enzyme [Mucilaginibacter]QEM03742.1 ubiquinone-dependent pyruvate dehydrogenase [Mucilaginibacter rubeus]QEM16353.1 ubiquinone-dependent pyruvate dehydrogenase [Mucilaginibacter gossypii]QTE40879.1 ubiquinone-dependent pyruvate dehydrogenase [Mucilaginibacter rubeus]QTE47482.1 ubiquinone-dependent pyruvate dehydrogenase [Mucilaginibacter rubeus]QTE58875.1 ubiquinone-dependent pyruvate dehydrogenase [Mucilaginibacter rubeus]
MTKNVSQQLVELLVNAGIKRIYSVTGDSLNEFNNAVRKDGNIQWIHVRHEEAGAFAAAADAELTGLACCAGSSGPGHVHLVNGLYDAHRSGVPVLAIVSTCATGEFGSGYFQETNTTRLFDDCSHYNQIANTAHQLPRMAQAAIQHAIQKKGVAVLGLPGDVAGLPAVDNISADRNYFPTATIQPSAAEIQELAELINSHRKICIFCGIGAAGAHKEVVELSSFLQAPVGYSFRGKMSIAHNNPNEVGMSGLLGLPAAYHSMHESDLILLLGTDFPYVPFIPQDKTLVQVDLQPERLGRRAKLDIGLWGDVKATITALMPLLERKTDNSFLKAQLQVHEKVKDHLLIYVNDKGKTDAIHPEAVAFIMDKLATDDAVFTVDTGMCCVWGARYITANGKRKLIGSFTHGSMANAMPQAIGAALAFPGRQIVAMCGDGGISMLLGDLATIKQYNLNIKIIVFNNRSLGMVKLEMEVAGIMDYQTDMENPDFAMVAEATGIKGITIHDPGQLESSMTQAMAHQGPVLVNVFTDPNALAMPPKLNFKMVKGMSLYMGKMMLGGKFEEVIDTLRANYKHLEDLNN